MMHNSWWKMSRFFIESQTISFLLSILSEIKSFRDNGSRAAGSLWGWSKASGRNIKTSTTHKQTFQNSVNSTTIKLMCKLQILNLINLWKLSQTLSVIIYNGLTDSNLDANILMQDRLIFWYGIGLDSLWAIGLL